MVVDVESWQQEYNTYAEKFNQKTDFYNTIGKIG